MINIAIADDHAVLVMGLKACFVAHPELQVVAECRNGQELLETLASVRADLVIMDINMPRLDGIATTYIIKDQYPCVNILAFSEHVDEKSILGMIHAGANGYLAKTALPEEIVRAIFSIADKGFYINETLSFTLVKQYRQNPATHPPTLADLNHREKEVLKLVCEEYSNQEIAKKLFVSTRTVEGYRSRLFEKSGAKNLAGLVLFAVKRGIV